MVSVTLLVVGKLKESYWREACAEYQKRMGSFCRLSVVEVEEYRLPDRPSPAQIQGGLEAEGKKLLQAIPQGAWVCALCIEGRELSSPQLAARLEQVTVGGKSQLVFVIGGSFGLHPSVKERAWVRLSMSPMTFPHHLARVMLLEQLYRGFKINEGSSYHK